jgi:outer membrane receptor protein involved in Fe transport
MRFFGKVRLLTSAAATALVAASPAFSQDEAAEDEIIVTATKRAQAIQDVPFSVNAQTQDDIQRTGAQNLEDIARSVAGLAIQNLGPGQSQVGIRGVSAGQIVRDQPGVKEQVGVYFDESVVSLSLFTPDLELFDLNRVETLRGPQGTLYGSGNIGGTIRYITNQPKIGEFEGTLEGNVNQVEEGGTGGHLKGAVNFPISDNAALRIVAFGTIYPGFIDALGEGGTITNDVNDGNRYGARVSLRWEPTPDIAITPRFTYQDINVDGFNRQEVYNLYANPFTTTRPAVNFQERRQHLLLQEAFEDRFIMSDLNAEWDMGPVSLTSITSYQARDILVSRDASALTHSVSIDLGYAPAAYLIPSNLRDTTQLKTFTQEARLASDYESRLQWLLGVFYTDIERNYAQRLPTPGYDVFTDLRFGAGTAAATNGAFPSDSPYSADLPYDIKQFAVFGEATLALTDRFDITAGARYYDFKEERAFVSGGLFSNGDNRTDSTQSDGFSPRFLLSYDVSDAVTLNAQASKGFRLGGVNDPLNVPLCSPADVALFGSFQDYDDETLWNYEGGVKVNSGRVTFNAAGYYTDIKNLQVTVDAGTCSSRISFNVPKAHTLGFEAELGAELFEGFDVSLSGNWVSAEFDSTLPNNTTVDPTDVIGGIRDGNRLASVPKLQLAASAQYSFPIGGKAEGFLAGSFQHISSRYTQPGDQEGNPRSFVSGLAFGGATGLNATVLDLELPSYQIVNLSAGITWDKTDLIFYVNNVTDENALLAFDRERGGRARLGFHTNQPRTFGVTARMHF